MNASSVIQLSQVSISFDSGRNVLENASLQVGEGEFVSVVGPSGCGKSTLLRLVAGLVAPSDGSVQIRDDGTRADGARLAFVFQEPTLLPWRTASGNVRLSLELSGKQKPWSAAIAESLRLVGLSEDDAGKRPSMLSGGMRMRVSLARALVTKPDILLMDEPFAALDELLRQQLNEELLRICRSQHVTVLFVTHNVSEAVFLSDRVAVMSSGPGTIVDEIDIPFDHPRDFALRSTADFAALTGRVSAALRGIGS